MPYLAESLSQMMSLTSESNAASLRLPVCIVASDRISFFAYPNLA